jgi:hypothetical protein
MSEKAIAEWAARHDIQGTQTDLRAMFEDAASFSTPRAAQPEQKQDSTCNKTLRAEGKGYPRTCRKCGKGPCIADRVQPEQTNPWRDAVDHELSILHMVASDDPRESIRRLIDWHCAVQIDPLVSSAAQELIERGRREALEQPEQEPVAWAVYCDGFIALPAFEDEQAAIKEMQRRNKKWPHNKREVRALYDGTPPAQPAQRTEQEPVAGLYAVLFVNNWDGEGDQEYVFAKLSEHGVWNRYEDGSLLFEYRGDKIISAWPLSEAAIPEAQPAQRTEQEPVKLPCCGYADASAVKWNPFNRVCQCHNCGQTYTPPAQPAQRQPLTDEQIIGSWEKSTGKKLPSTGPSISQLIAYTRVVEAAHGIKEKNT